MGLPFWQKSVDQCVQGSKALRRPPPPSPPLTQRLLGTGERRLAVLVDEITRYLTREIPATNGLKRLLVFRPTVTFRGPVDGGAAALATRCEVAERSTITVSWAA